VIEDFKLPESQFSLISTLLNTLSGEVHVETILSTDVADIFDWRSSRVHPAKENAHSRQFCIPSVFRRYYFPVHGFPVFFPEMLQVGFSHIILKSHISY